jgi:hypothetical protein
MGGAVTSVLFTRDRRVFFEDEDLEIREATAVERVQALLGLRAVATSPPAASDA